MQGRLPHIDTTLGASVCFIILPNVFLFNPRYVPNAALMLCGLHILHMSAVALSPGLSASSHCP